MFVFEEIQYIIQLRDSVLWILQQNVKAVFLKDPFVNHFFTAAFKHNCSLAFY